MHDFCLAHEFRYLCGLRVVRILFERLRWRVRNVERVKILVFERVLGDRQHHPLPFGERHVLHGEHEQIFVLAARHADFWPEVHGCGTALANLATACDLRHHRVAHRVLRRGIGLKIRRKLGECPRECDRVGRLLEVERWHADDEIHGGVFQIGQLVQQRRLEFDDGFTVGIEFDPVVGDPANALLNVGHADLSRVRRWLTGPVEFHRE